MFPCRIHLLLLVVIVSSSDRGDCEGFLTFSQRRAKRYSSGLLVACVILILCWLWGPYWGFGMWSQLAREPPSEWIATTRTSLPASKWTSVKKSLYHHLIPRWLVFIGIHSCDWLVHSFTRWYNLLAYSLHYRKLVVKLFSVTSCESLLVWLVWLFS